MLERYLIPNSTLPEQAHKKILNLNFEEIKKMHGNKNKRDSILSDQNIKKAKKK